MKDKTMLHTLKTVLKDPLLFIQAASGLHLRAYQVPIARAVVRSVLQKQGLSLVVMFPRQSGKNELQAQLEVYLLTLFSQQPLPCEMVKISPTWKPQSQNAMRRLETVLKRNLFTRTAWCKEAGGLPAVPGYHYLQLLEIAGNGITVTYYGNNGIQTDQSGASGTMWG